MLLQSDQKCYFNHKCYSNPIRNVAPIKNVSPIRNVAPIRDVAPIRNVIHKYYSILKCYSNQSDMLFTPVGEEINATPCSHQTSSPSVLSLHVQALCWNGGLVVEVSVLGKKGAEDGQSGRHDAQDVRPAGVARAPVVQPRSGAVVLRKLGVKSDRKYDDGRDQDHGWITIERNIKTRINRNQHIW